MIDYHPDLVSALNTVLPKNVWHELKLTKDTKTPCISFMENNNYDVATGNTLGYSRLSYTVKVWGNNLGELQQYAVAIDKALRPLGWSRVSGGELHDTQSTMIQKIMTYEALALETY